MSIASETAKVIYTGNNSAVDFPVTFKFFESSEIAVWLYDIAADTYTLLTLTTHYTVAGGSATEGATGTVTTLATYTSAKKIIIVRSVPFTQPVDLENQGRWYPQVHENEFDRLVQQIQQLKEQVDRAYKVGLTDTNPSVNELLDKLSDLIRLPVLKLFSGDAQDTVVFGQWTANVDCYLEEMALEAFGGAPTGADLICQVKITRPGDAEVTEATTFSLPATDTYIQAFPATATSIYVPQDSVVKFFFSQVGSVLPGTNVGVTAYFRPKRL
ncbi:MAG: hypothetical protein WCS70_09055 [Verrucomicrobiota bacterium]